MCDTSVKHSLEGEQVALRIVLFHRIVVIDDGKDDQPEAILKLSFSENISEKLGHMLRGIGKSATAKGTHDQAVVAFRFTDPEDGADLFFGGFDHAILQSQETIYPGKAGIGVCRHGDHVHLAGMIKQVIAGGLRRSKDGQTRCIDPA